MTKYSQRDPRWAYQRLGTSGVTIGNYGCAITALGNLANKTPEQVNNILKRGGGFLHQNLVIWSKACELLGLQWKGQSSSPTHYPTIAQVRGNGFPMHFVVWLGNNQIIDSWDGLQKKNPYLVVLFDNVKAPVTPPPPAPSKPFMVRVDKAVANVRSAPRSNAPLAGSRQLYKNTVFVAAGVVSGESVGGNNKWYRSQYGNYVWSGGLTRI